MRGPPWWAPHQIGFDVGGVLLSHTLTSAVPSALEGLASGFGMGPGVPPPLKPPTTLSNFCISVTDTATTPNPQHKRRESREGVVCSGSHSGCEQHVTPQALQHQEIWLVVVVSPRPISTSQLHLLPGFHIWPINPVVSRGPYPTSGEGDLILERASRLDAFSGYPFRT